VLLGIDHVGIACRDIHGSMRRYRELFGLDVVRFEERPASGVLEAMLAVSPTALTTAVGGARDGHRVVSYVQLLQPLRDDTALGRFLHEHGEGIQHVGYAVADLASVVPELERRGARLVPDMPAHGILGSSIAFLEPSSAAGVLTELVEIDEHR